MFVDALIFTASFVLFVVPRKPAVAVWTLPELVAA